MLVIISYLTLEQNLEIRGSIVSQINEYTTPNYSTLRKLEHVRNTSFELLNEEVKVHPQSPSQPKKYLPEREPADNNEKVEAFLYSLAQLYENTSSRDPL